LEFVSKIRRTILRRGMVRPGETILVACSGGADSTALLHALNDLRAGLSLHLAVAHFDHGLRAASARDARFVHESAAGLNLPFYLEKRDVRSVARRRRLNLEEAGRLLRYEFLNRTAASIGAAKIATGHTLDDQAETVLMRMLRGSGPRGLGGIAPIHDGTIIRPLIEVRRKDVMKFLHARGLAHTEDETNRDRAYLRNAVRHRLLPYLEKYFEPAIAEKLGRTAEVLAGEDLALDAHIRRIMPGLVAGKGPTARLNADALALLPAGLSRRCVRAFVETHKGDLLRVSFDDVENVRNLSRGKIAVLPGSLRLTREGFWIRRAPARAARKKTANNFQYRWEGGAPLAIAETGTTYSARIVPGGLVLNPPFDDARRVWLDADRLVFPLIVRSPREGDRYRPLGAPGRQKINELMRARRIPPPLRKLRPVFESEGVIVWVEGLPVADAFQVGPATRRLFLIEKGETQR